MTTRILYISFDIEEREREKYRVYYFHFRSRLVENEPSLCTDSLPDTVRNRFGSLVEA